MSDRAIERASERTQQERPRKRATMQGPKFEALVLGLYAIAILAGAYAVAVLTVLPRWLAFIAGGLGGMLLAIAVNALIVFALGFRTPPGD